MAGRLAILAGSGALPVALATAYPDALRVVFEGVAHALDGPTHAHRFERLGTLFDWLHDRGVDRVVLAGGMARPALDPADFDPEMARIAPALAQAMQRGDDAVLRFVVTLFEARGFAVLGAAELLPGLTAAAGHIAGPPPHPGIVDDAARGAEMLAGISPLDLGQACVVERGLCLGVETLQGTAFLLDGVSRTPGHLRAPDGVRGVLVKAPKQGQDLRVDMPAIGPDTAERCIAAFDAAGVTLLARER